MDTRISNSCCLLFSLILRLSDLRDNDRSDFDVVDFRSAAIFVVNFSILLFPCLFFLFPL
uniref:Transmembrane protein n=1 Tax=Rhizophora mucronata TaxID=61149 RepID=A0A2P2N7P0_RHIMU